MPETKWRATIENKKGLTRTASIYADSESQAREFFHLFPGEKITSLENTGKNSRGWFV